MNPMNPTNESIAMSVSRATIIGNVILSIFKLVAGIFAHSSAMLSDAVHSLSDVLSTFIVMIGVKIANKQADKEHPYGHERFECVAALILALILFATGGGIGYSGLQAIIAGQYDALPVPGLLALVAALISIVVKEAMYWYTKAAAQRIDSGALMADAWHHRSDALSSIGSFVGILGSRLGFPVLDSVACLVICAFIVKAAWSIFADSINKMTDTSCSDKTLDDIRALVLAQDNVAGIDLLHTRLFGDKIYIDMEICVDKNATLDEAHDIAHVVHDAIEKHFTNVKHCMIHVNPVDLPQRNIV